METVAYSDFKKLDIRVGTIMEVDRVPGTEKLYKMQVDTGGDRTIQIVSSLVPYYKQEELLNRRIVVLVNLEPTTFRGELSQGMLLAAETEDASECVLLTTEGQIANGTRIT
jgi:tRNA-binding protein